MRFDGGNARVGLHREGDDGDFPEVDLADAADAGLGLLARADGTEADREPVDGTAADEREHFTGALDVWKQSPLGVKAAGVFKQLIPDTDGNGRIVLEQHADAVSFALAERFTEGAGEDDVVAEVFGVEEGGVALERAGGGIGCEVDGGEFGFERGGCREHGGILL